MPKADYFVNAHAHCFTVEHVPDNFMRTLTWLSPLLRIRFIKNGFIRYLIYFLGLKGVRKMLGFFMPAFVKALPRMVNFAENFDVKTQEQMIRSLQAYYPDKTRFVLLTMDMEYMAAGLPGKDFKAQLNELKECMKLPDMKGLLYPFVFADPRRPEVGELVTSYLTDSDAPFKGIKIYPALGYYPFDKRLKEVYDYALAHNVPITTHCIKGSVYYRGKKSDLPEFAVHPISGKPLPYKKAVDFSANFTHPYNYECLLNRDILSKYWGKDAPDYSKLKICFGHFGGEEEWLKYLQDTGLPDKDYNARQPDCLNIDNHWYDVKPTRKERGEKAYSWFSIIRELMNKYDNIYADISYTLCEPRILPLLKALLQNDDNKLSQRILFGTDYFVVSKAGAEREMSLYVRGYLGDDLWNKIAYHNPNRFLGLV